MTLFTLNTRARLALQPGCRCHSVQALAVVPHAAPHLGLKATLGESNGTIMTTAGHMRNCHTCGAAGEKEECFRASAVGSFRSPPMCSLKLCTGTRATVRRCSTSPRHLPISCRCHAPSGDVAGLQLDRRWFGIRAGSKVDGEGAGHGGQTAMRRLRAPLPPCPHRRTRLV